MFNSYFLSCQLLEIMAEGLQPTIRDVVRQTLLGQVPVASTDKVDTNNSSAEDKTKSNDSATTLNEEAKPSTNSVAEPAAQDEDTNDEKLTKLLDPDERSELVPKSEPLAESTNQENSVDGSSDPAVNKELAEKLTWKHKCEIEAVKHNAGRKSFYFLGVIICMKQLLTMVHYFLFYFVFNFYIMYALTLLIRVIRN